jgi:hypothetical protein
VTGYPEPWVYRLARRDLSTASTQEVRASADAQRLVRRARNARKKARARGAWPAGAKPMVTPAMRIRAVKQAEKGRHK